MKKKKWNKLVSVLLAMVTAGRTAVAGFPPFILFL